VSRALYTTLHQLRVPFVLVASTKSKIRRQLPSGVKLVQQEDMRPVRPLHVVIVKGEHFKTCPKQRNTVVKFVKLVHLQINRVKPVVKFVHPVHIWSMMVYCWVITIKQVIVNNAKQEHFYKTMLPQYPTILLRLIVSLARWVDINHILVQRHVHCAVLVLRTMKSKQPPLRSVNLVLLRLTRTNKANNIVRHLLPVCLFVFFLLIFFC
jgi:hypothetical protein